MRLLKRLCIRYYPSNYFSTRHDTANNIKQHCKWSNDPTEKPLSTHLYLGPRRDACVNVFAMLTGDSTLPVLALSATEPHSLSKHSDLPKKVFFYFCLFALPQANGRTTTRLQINVLVMLRQNLCFWATHPNVQVLKVGTLCKSCALILPLRALVSNCARGSNERSFFCSRRAFFFRSKRERERESALRREGQKSRNKTGCENKNKSNPCIIYALQ